MARSHIRQLKRAAYAGDDVDAMRTLLNRSIRFGHRRLALIRCMQAEQLGITVEPEILSYCRSIADNMSHDDLIKLIRQVSKTCKEN